MNTRQNEWRNHGPFIFNCFYCNGCYSSKSILLSGRQVSTENSRLSHDLRQVPRFRDCRCPPNRIAFWCFFESLFINVYLSKLFSKNHCLSDVYQNVSSFSSHVPIFHMIHMAMFPSSSHENWDLGILGEGSALSTRRGRDWSGLAGGGSVLAGFFFHCFVFSMGKSIQKTDD